MLSTSKGSVIPHFFLVGAPKSGTTAMTEYLRQHPDIFMPVKELHFFGTDLKIKPPMANFYTCPRSLKEINKYLSYFENAGKTKTVGESSVFYLYSKRAAFEIKKFCPKARIIVMLRNPVDMIYSLHSQYLFGGNEDITNFDSALQAEKSREEGFKIPPSAHFAKGLLYTKVAQYSEQLKRYFDVFGKESVQVIIFDDFKENTSIIYKNLLKFLGVYETYEPSFMVFNPNKVVRLRTLSKFLRSPPDGLKRLLNCIFPNRYHRSLARKLRQLNTKIVPRPAMEAGLRYKLNRKFSQEVHQLSQLLDRDITFWLNEQ